MGPHRFTAPARRLVLAAGFAAGCGDDLTAADPGVACTDDGTVCLCDPRFHDDVPSLHTSTFYRAWIDLGEDPPVPHDFTGAGDNPGDEFYVRGDAAFDCHLASTAPRLTVPAFRAHAFVAVPPGAVTPEIVAAVPFTAPSVAAVYPPDRWSGRTLVVRDEGGRSYALAVGFYQTPCLGTADDHDLLIEYTALGLFCPDGP